MEPDGDDALASGCEPSVTGSCPPLYALQSTGSNDYAERAGRRDFDRGTSSGGGRGARFRTRRKLSKNEEKNLNDMVQEMALFVDHMICDGNKNLG